ncbi:MAG TPA: hypothetical protein VFZ97_00945 [Acidimicrobiales bacterium]
MTPIVSVATASGGHPWWHFGLVAGAGVVTFVGIRLAERVKRSGWTISKPTPLTIWFAALSLAASAIHISVCAEHFREWIVYGLFFVFASIAQAIWSVLVLTRPGARLLLLGAFGNNAVVVLFIFSRTVGMPFGPEAFRAERLTTPGLIATACELLLVTLACYGARTFRHEPRAIRSAI